MVTTVYCDDAGFTGDNLLNTRQPYFAYSAVAIEPDQAAALVAELRSTFNLTAAELKGINLYGRPYAFELLSRLIAAIGPRVSIALNHKLFSLAGKFFEYVYEPSIAPSSSFFYERGTHLYVATALWAYLSIGDPLAEDVAARFEALMRRRAGIEPIYFDDAVEPSEYGPLEPIIRFAIAQRETAMAELDQLAGKSGRIRFVLDLSFSSAKSVLATLGERFGELDVVMDESLPLQDFSTFFSAFIGNTKTYYMELGGRRRPLNFNLHRPLQFCSSNSEPGLQIADIFASFAAAASRDSETVAGAAMLDALTPLVDPDTVIPSIANIDLSRKPAMMNMCLVSELADRAEKKQPLLVDIDRYYHTMSYLYDVNPPSYGLND